MTTSRIRPRAALAAAASLLCAASALVASPASPASAAPVAPVAPQPTPNPTSSGHAGAPTQAPAPAAARAGDHLVINEVYGGGGNSGAPFKNDFVELYNPTAAAIDVTGWQLEYFSATGGSGGTCSLTGSVPASTYYLAQQSAGTGGGAALPTPEVTCGLAMGGTNGAVQLSDAAGAVVDLVGYGTANSFEGAAAPALSNSTSAYRITPGEDTDNNAADFTTGAPNPTNGGGDGGTPTPTATPTATPTGPVTPGARVPIAQVQGTGDRSPMRDQTVTVRGVVTANYPTGGFNGFYLQTPGSGGTPKAAGDASDGLFAYGNTSVEVGRCYDVTGKVTEYPGNAPSGAQTLTELTGLTLAAAEGCAPVAPTPLASLPATDADKEPYEGMLVQPAGAYTITNNYALNQYGQLGLAFGDKPLYTPTDKVPYPEAAAYEAEQQKLAITLDDGSGWDYMNNAEAKKSPLPYLSQQTPLRTGSQLEFGKPVILDYRFGWNFQPTGQVVGSDSEQIPMTSENDRPAGPPQVGGELQLATFNILNYFNDLGEQENAVKPCRAYTDRDGNPVTARDCQVRGAWTPSAFADQQHKITKAINTSGAEVVGLMEVENSAGLTWITRDRDYTLNHLVEQLNAAGGNWAAVPSPLVTPSGEDVIRTAFIYDKAKAAPVGASQILLDDAFANARYPLAQEFRSTSSALQFVAIANHFKSKGSGPDDGTGQGNSNPARKEQARALTAWANQNFAQQATLLVGDFNAYSKEEPVQIIEEAGFANVENPDETTYQFGGRLGSLDHIFANEAAQKLVTGAGVWNINADESVAMQYSRRNYNVTDFYTPDVWAASDHDPALVGLQAAGTPTPKPDSPITAKWKSLGGEQGPVGKPAGPEVCGIRGGGCFRYFANGGIYESAATAPQWVHGAILDKWASLGWETGRLGYPTSDEFCGLRDGGCAQRFTGGLIYWTPGTGAHPVWGAIGERYASLRWETSILGYPTGDEICGLRGGGCTQRFTGGLIAWSPATGAQPVWGAIYQRYAELRWETSQLGYPIEPEFCGLRDGGCAQRFTGGMIHWSRYSGPWASWGLIGERWGANGWETGRYGYPTFREVCGPVDGAWECRQNFQGGTIIWNSVRGFR